MREYQATVHNGQLVLAKPLEVPDGAPVKVLVPDESVSVPGEDPFDNIDELAGPIGPEDSAIEHDNYLYGIPRILHNRREEEK